MQSNRNTLSHLVDKIIHSKVPTEISKTLKEIERNNDYIEEIQLKELIQLHDQTLKTKCVDPLTKMYEYFAPYMEKDYNIQTEAAVIDRDLRIIEHTLQTIKANQKE